MSYPAERVARLLTAIAASTNGVFGANLNLPFALIGTILPPGEQRDNAKMLLVFSLEQIRKAIVADIVARGKEVLGYEVETEVEEDEEDQPKETKGQGFYG